MKSYVGQFGERITANDERGQEFVDAYARLAADGIARSASGLSILTKIVDAAGGELRIGNYGHGDWHSRPRRLTISTDEATCELVLRVTDIKTE